MSDQDNPYKWILDDCQIPALYSQDGKSAEEAVVHVKLFMPYHNWTWLLLEYDPEEELAFGFSYDAAFPQGAELGYISFKELQQVSNMSFATKVCRDILFEPTSLAEAKKSYCPHALQIRRVTGPVVTQGQ